MRRRNNGGRRRCLACLCFATKSTPGCSLLSRRSECDVNLVPLRTREEQIMRMRGNAAPIRVTDVDALFPLLLRRRGFSPPPALTFFFFPPFTTNSSWAQATTERCTHLSPLQPLVALALDTFPALRSLDLRRARPPTAADVASLASSSSGAGAADAAPFPPSSAFGSDTDAFAPRRRRILLTSVASALPVVPESVVDAVVFSAAEAVRVAAEKAAAAEEEEEGGGGDGLGASTRPRSADENAEPPSSPPSPPRTIADFSSAASSGIQTAARTPKQGESIARETPVEPAVPSATRPPGRSEGGALAPAPAPASPTPPLVVVFVASPRIAAATRSLTDPPGFENSALARICILGGREAGGGDLR